MSKSTTDNQPATFRRRTFFGHAGGLLAGLFAAIPVVRGWRQTGSTDTGTASPAGSERVKVQIHPQAVPRTSERSVPYV